MVEFSPLAEHRLHPNPSDQGIGTARGGTLCPLPRTPKSLHGGSGILMDRCFRAHAHTDTHMTRTHRHTQTRRHTQIDRHMHTRRGDAFRR